MVIDDKLFRIYEEAHAEQYESRSDLARAVAGKKLNEFSYQRNGEKQYLTWGTIVDYVGLLVDYGMISVDLKPTIQTVRVSRRGFDLTLGENVEGYANRSGFSVEQIKTAVRELLSRSPAQLPTPPTVCTMLQVPVGYPRFQKAMSVRAFQQRIHVHPKLKNVIIVPDLFRE